MNVVDVAENQFCVRIQRDVLRPLARGHVQRRRDLTSGVEDVELLGPVLALTRVVGSALETIEVQQHLVGLAGFQ